MKATIDKAGRLVIPKPLRDVLGLTPGQVDVEVRGAGLLIMPETDDSLTSEDDLLVIPAGGVKLTDEEVRALKEAGQK